MSMRIVALIGATFVTIGTAAVALAPPANACSTDFYKAASGHCVHRPVCTPAPPPGATAQCRDGCYSFSEDPTDDDTCHGRGGVKQYF
jgi:hypothetical protein